MGRWLGLLACFATAALTPLTAAHASRVSPMAVDLRPFGRESIARIQFGNTADRDFPIEVLAFRGEISETGELTLEPADEEFLIFPPQLVVAPLSEQMFRVQYVGNPDLAQAEVYYISVQQLPVELEEGPPQIQVLVNFNVFVNVEPEGATSSPRIVSVEADTVEDQGGLAIRVANDGNGMLLAGRQNWTLKGLTPSGAPFEREFDTAVMGETIGAGVVAPGKVRRFFLPLDADVDPASVSVELS